MKKKQTIQERMFQEMKEQKIFEQALKSGNTYLDNVFQRNVSPTLEAIENLSIFEEELPSLSSDASEIIQCLDSNGAPATGTQIGGRYFGFVNGGIIPTALAAKIMASFWDQNAAMQAISPLASQLEMVVEKWLKQLFSLPENTAAGFVSGTSSELLCGLAAAWYRILKNKNWDVNEKGLNGAPPIRIVAGKDVHATALKMIGLLGLGKQNIEWVDVDDQGRIIPELIPALDDTTILMLQAGNVNSGSFDDFATICTKARKTNTWVHIDGAFGLWAAAVEKLKHLTKGIELANSWSVDGHKTLNTPYDSGIVLCEDKEALVSALHASGSYLVLSEQRDGMFFTPEMSRRARINELWAAIKYLGREGMDEMIYGFHERALQFAEALKANGFEVLNDVVFNQILVSCDTDRLTNETLGQIQEQRVCWCGGAEWRGKKVIRVSICSWMTTAEDVTLSVGSFVKARNGLVNDIS